MLNHDAADDNRASYHDDPVDHMEPGLEIEETQEQMLSRIEHECYREAGIKSLAFTFSLLAFINEASSPTEFLIRFWAVLSSLDHPACDGRNDSEIAGTLGTTRANFCKHKLSFQRQNTLPPTLSQKTVAARQSYRVARKAQLA